MALSVELEWIEHFLELSDSISELKALQEEAWPNGPTSVYYAEEMQRLCLERGLLGTMIIREGKESD